MGQVSDHGIGVWGAWGSDQKPGGLHGWVSFHWQLVSHEAGIHGADKPERDGWQRRRLSGGRGAEIYEVCHGKPVCH